MLFRNKYWTSMGGDTVEEWLMRVPDVQPCWSCGNVTSFVDTELGDFVCSEECRVKFHAAVGKGKTKFAEGAKRQGAYGIVIEDDGDIYF